MIKNKKLTSKCNFCSVKESKYSCPRCNFDYCSVDCYRSEKHQKCSESFYKQCVTEVLKSDLADNQSKKDMLDVLTRHNQQLLDDEDGHSSSVNSDNECDDSNLSVELSKLNVNSMNSDQLWQCLSHQEKQEFNSMLDSGKISQVIPKFEPWWQRKKRLINFVDDVEDSHWPKDITDIKKLSDLTKIVPSPFVKFNLLNCLYGYAYVILHYNGDHFDVASEAAFAILDISRNLSCGQSYQSIEEAIQCAINAVLSKKDSLFSTNEYSTNVINDIRSIVDGQCADRKRCYILAALSELKRLLCQAKKELDKNNDQRKKLSMSIKKVEYYLSWTLDFGHHMQEVATNLTYEFLTKSKDLEVHEKLEKNVEKVKDIIEHKEKKLIEVIN